MGDYLKSAPSTQVHFLDSFTLAFRAEQDEIHTVSDGASAGFSCVYAKHVEQHRRSLLMLDRTWQSLV